MNKNQTSKITQFVAGALTAIIAFSSVPAANAGMFDWLKNWSGKNEYLSSAQDLSHAYVSDNRNRSTETEDDSKTEIVDDGYVLAKTVPAVGKEQKQNNQIPATFREVTVSVTAYSSTPDQTDDSPFITAKGTYVRDGIVAANFLPFGTKIMIPEVFGDKVFVVEDRMNKRYWQKVDVWFPERQSALEFGHKVLKIQILES